MEMITEDETSQNRNGTWEFLYFWFKVNITNRETKRISKRIRKLNGVKRKRYFEMEINFQVLFLDAGYF